MTHQELKSLTLENIRKSAETEKLEKYQDMLLDKAVKEMLNDQVSKYNPYKYETNFTENEMVLQTLELYWYECNTYKGKTVI